MCIWPTHSSPDMFWCSTYLLSHVKLDTRTAHSGSCWQRPVLHTSGTTQQQWMNDEFYTDYLLTYVCISPEGDHINVIVFGSENLQVISLNWQSPLTSTWPHLRCDVGLEEGEYRENCLCVTVLCTIIMLHKDMNSSYRSVDYIGLWSCLISSLSSKHHCIFDLHGAIYIHIYIVKFFGYIFFAF